VLRLGWVSPPPVFWIFMEQGKIIEAEAPTVPNRTNGTPTPTTPKVFTFTGRMPFLPPNQQRQSTEIKFKQSSSFDMHSFNQNSASRKLCSHRFPASHCTGVVSDNRERSTIKFLRQETPDFISLVLWPANLSAP